MVASSTSAAPRRRRTGAALLVVAVTATLMLLLTSEGAAATAAKTKNKQLPRRRGGGGGVSSSPIFTKLSTSLSGSAAASKKKIENLEGGSQEGSMPRALAIYSTGCERERSNWAGATPFFLHAHFLTFIPILSLFAHARRFATPKIDGHWGDWARKVDRAPDKTKLLIGEGIFFQKKRKKLDPQPRRFSPTLTRICSCWGRGGSPSAEAFGSKRI